MRQFILKYITMKHISIILPVGHTSLVNIEGTYQIFSMVNDLMEATGKVKLFTISLVGLSKEVSQTTGLFTVNSQKLLNEVKKTDMIFIPAIHGNPADAIKNNQEFIPWIVNNYNKGAEVVSFCIGAFFLAATGLLNGKNATTHWMFSDLFRTMYPDVNLLDDKIMTEHDRVYTSGGAYSYLNLIIYIVEKYAGREVALQTAKTFMIDIDKGSQAQFIMFKGQKEHSDNEIKKAQNYIEQNFDKRITVTELAEKFALSKRNLERRFKKATSNTVSEYIQRVKVEAAKKQLENSSGQVSEVMYNVGYNDTKAFRTVFKKVTGLSPAQYKMKYNRAAIV